MNAPIIFVSGSKGGVGKSITTMALIDYMIAKKDLVRFIEADTTNPDVWRCYGKTVEHDGLDLDEVDGWIQLLNVCDAQPFKSIVVNTPARNNTGVSDHGALLLESLKELGRPLITLWIINRQRDSLELLKEYMDLMPASIVHVVRNGYFGESHKFELYDNSAIRQTIEQREGKSLYLPDLADRVTDELYSKRITLAQASAQMKIGDRAELQRWRAATAQMFASIGL